MNDTWKTVKLGIYVFALPLVATAAASAHQWMTVSSPITMPAAAMTTSVSNGATFATVRDHNITLDQDGVVRGRLVSIDQASFEAIGLGGLKVYFARNGKVIKRVETQSDGSFKAEGLDVGAYSFIASGESGFAAYGVNIVSGDSTPTVMEVAAVSPKFNVVKEIIDNRVPPRVAAEIAELAKSNLETSAPIALAGSNRVIINDGVLVGSVVSIWGQHKTIAGTSVHIVKDQKEIATVRVDQSGEFQISDLTPGVYDFVAAGPAGFAAVSFEAVEDESTLVHVSVPVDDSASESAVEADSDKEVITVIAADYANYEPSASLYVCLTSPQDAEIVSDTVVQADAGIVDDYVAPPIEYAGEVAGEGCAAGAACGGSGDFSGYGACCGGGGGGGAVYGGGMGRLLGLAALGIGIGALASGGSGGGNGPITPSEP